MPDTGLDPRERIIQLKEEKKNQKNMVKLLSLALLTFFLAGGYTHYLTMEYNLTIRELSRALHWQREQFLDCIDDNRVPPHVDCSKPISPEPNEIIKQLEND